ncbi:MAG TPA: flagellar basal body L-ring protein FlgH [Kofleriaceae bacterium]|nr:flagellar basal body L-ring protein FlgH [Kofleriaceae bacterium]
MKLVALTALCALGCVSHIAPYHEKHRKLDPHKFGARSQPRDGSIYADGTPGLLEDPKASRVGDILVINIDEKDLASHQADTKLNKQDATTYGMPNALGLAPALAKKYPGTNLSALLATTTNQQFTGDGQIQRQGQVTATLPVQVMEVLASGDYFVEGTKTVKVGDEEHQIYVSGIVRRIDIADDDSVPSSRIADAEIEYTGRGDISDTQRRGWLSRIISKLWPF